MENTFPSVTALVPIKHNSERLPGKNRKDFCGKPLFYWILDTLSRSKFINQIIVNTDSKFIANEIKENPKILVINRPTELIGKVGIMALINNDINYSHSDHFLQTHCTNPLLRTQTIDHAIKEFFLDKSTDSLIGVTKIFSRFYNSKFQAINHDPNSKNLRTQDLAPLYEENSCLYLFSRELIEKKNHRVGSRPNFFVIDPKETIDIDEEYDFELAEYFMRKRIM